MKLFKSKKAPYDSLKKDINKQLKQVQAVDNMFPDVATLVVVIICIIIDAIFIFQITQILFTESAYMSLITAGTTAFCIDVLPIVIVNKIQKRNRDYPNNQDENNGHSEKPLKISNEKLDTRILRASVTLLLLLMIGIVLLRFATMEHIFGSGSNISFGRSVGNDTDSQIGFAHFVMTLILSLIPISTSIITFGFATHKSSKRKKKDLSDRLLMENALEKSELNIRISETNRELERNLDLYEEKNRDIMNDTVLRNEEVLDMEAKLALAMKLKTADAATELLEEES